MSRGFDLLSAISGSVRRIPLQQLPTALAFAIAVGIVFLDPADRFVHPVAVLSGTAGMVLATLLAFVFDRFARRSRWVSVIPVLSLLAIGTFIAGTNGVGSLFSAMFVLPIVWLASEAGRWYLVVAAAVSSLAFYMPYLLGLNAFDPKDPDEIWYGVFPPIVFLLVAITINELSRHARERLARLRESEAQTRAAEQFTRSVLDAVTEQAVIGTDLHGIVDVWNPGAVSMFAEPVEAVIGIRNIVSFHDGTELDAAGASASSAVSSPAAQLADRFAALVEPTRGGMRNVREWTYVRRDGSRIPVEVEITPRPDPAGETVGFIFVAADMTRAYEAARLKDEFIGLVSHELRTPISAVLGHLELLRIDADAPLTAEQLRHVAVADRNARRLLRLVGDLLLTAQVEAGQFQLERQPVRLRQLIEASIESARPGAAEAGVELAAAIAADQTVSGDPVRLAQVIDNLLSNAIKFTPRGGAVTVSLEAEGDLARLGVRDTGLGISAEDLEQMFQRFFRASSATRNAVPGIGLGLYITRAIVASHGGSVDVASTEGAGAEVIVRLPLAG